MRRLSPLDYAFIQVDRQHSPAHVATLAILEPPASYREDATGFVADLFKRLLRMTEVGAPFNLVLKGAGFAGLPHWEEEPDIDLDYHVNHIRIPSPGDMDSLLGVVARIHSRQLDRTRPLWECYVIEGLAGHRFAIYTKMHHALVDGVTGMKILDAVFSPEQKPDQGRVLWNPQLKQHQRKRKEASWLVNGAKMLRLGQEVVKDVLGQGMQMAGYQEGASALAFHAPHSMLNGKISGARRLITHSLPIDRMKKAGHKIGASLNDVLLMISSDALRRYLQRQGQLPEKPLVTMVPVSVAQEGRPGNNVSYMMANLATDKEGLAERIAHILHSVQVAKADIAHMSRDAARIIAGATAGSLAAGMVFSDLATLVPPAANVVISNVPGPKDDRYFFGAKLLHLYPASMLVDSQALNITAVSVGNSLDIGLTGCRESLPDILDIKQDFDNAFEDLEKALARKAVVSAILDHLDELNHARQDMAS